MGVFDLLHRQPPSYEKKKHYRIGKTLGSGSYGEVKEAQVIKTGEFVAIKVIRKDILGDQVDMIDKELEVVKKVAHPHIVAYVDSFESRDKYYLIFQLARGGELFERIIEQGKFTEKDATRFMKTVIDAIDYLHDHNIVHRDLKPENLLFKDESPDAPLMIVDFGIAKSLSDDQQVLSTVCGSHGYTAPEILWRSGYGKPVDMWSIGVITYTLLCGYLPFQRWEGHPDYMNALAKAKFKFDEKYWVGISDDAKDFITQLLNPDQNKRMTAKEALKHRWLTGETASDKDLLDNVRENFNPKRTLRRAVEVVQLINRLKVSRTNTTSSEGWGDEVSSLSTSKDDSAPAESAKPPTAEQHTAEKAAGAEETKEEASKKPSA
ncbi:calcium/calmodulin-dependent protein kinase 1 [Basidiobolus meristosporus CBS 931.73]|uniref:Calcium/calmodulin-dependent protein kinase 1 n=1 Tax=Basidiobolus meristosporus CBS 931.73 TaxID=1314790 RepID=A0A1Y1YJE5_9FUNG|nr:calcium/calmodulin-dependent protein kinase 1 [Basidiobolus meristosporus CBS 931.73]|eukprot:ORX98102.1 calcium/calmodulin-dependent protein kinase 1 [Basidiobolus meristosporus CBS 931.73]